MILHLKNNNDYRNGSHFMIYYRLMINNKLLMYKIYHKFVFFRSSLKLLFHSNQKLIKTCLLIRLSFQNFTKIKYLLLILSQTYKKN